MPKTLVALHAHPDDEALLTAGTMARAAAQGHRVVLVLATDGGSGLAAQTLMGDGGLAQRRRAEAHASAQALGVARVVHLGYADSGLDDERPDGAHSGADPDRRTRFIDAPVDAAAGQLAEVLSEESADVLLSYDENGGYGHRDHVQVHHVGARAAALAGTPRLLEATIPRDTICRAIAVAQRLYRFPDEFDPSSFQRAYSAQRDITHRVNVTRQIGAKRAAMRAHASQATADGDADRTLAAFLRLPRPLFDAVFAREWYVDPTRRGVGRVGSDIFEGLDR